jgi:murein L,D-transpeptidase YcbB/YkuD
MSILRLGFYSLLGSVVGAVGASMLSVPSSAKGSDNWQVQSAFDRAQGLGFQNFGSKRKNYRRREYDGFFDFGGSGFFNRRDFRRYDKRRYRVFRFDQPDAVEVGKPKSPDAGFANYQPVKLVALSNPKLEAPTPSQVLASTILDELRNPDTPISVTPQQRDAIINFYRLNTFAPLWITSEGLNAKAKRVLELLSRAEEEGLNPSDYLPPTLGSFQDSASTIRGDVTHLARLDIAITAMALRYAEHLYSGRIIPKRLSGYYDLEPDKLDLGHTLYELWYRGFPNLYLSSLAPPHPAYAAMKAALAQLRKEGHSSEPAAIAAGKQVKTGERDARVVSVRSRMVEAGLLSEENALAWMLGHPSDEPDLKAYEEVLDNALSKALKAFQAKNKIKQTGWINKATVEALNAKPAQNNAQKLVMNMERVRWLPRNVGQRYILVNQAAFELRLMEQNKIAWSTKVIVGKPETQTFVFSDEMETVVINPYWGVPQSIIRYEMMPYLARDRGYLDREGFEVVNARGKVVSSRSVNWWAYGSKIPFGVRQPPGDDNALGRIKFLFPNAHDIYMHDTPTKKLFAEDVRAFSHGCVRVENPRELAERVLGWERKRIDDLIATGQNQDIDLAKHIPVHLNYFTAWPDASGKITYYPDIYNRDTRLDKAINTITLVAN